MSLARDSRFRIAWIRSSAKGRNPVPKEVRFTTWTLRYNKMFWVTIDAHGRSTGSARGSTRRSTAMRFALTTAERDGDAPGVRHGPGAVRCRQQADADDRRHRPSRCRPSRATSRSSRAREDRHGGWRLGEPPSAGLRKIHGLQGPIDDAFMDAVRVRAADRHAALRGAGEVGAGAGRLRRSASGCTSSAASRA